jgi:hypothetical protein
MTINIRELSGGITNSMLMILLLGVGFLPIGCTKADSKNVDFSSPSTQSIPADQTPRNPEHSDVVVGSTPVVINKVVNERGWLKIDLKGSRVKLPRTLVANSRDIFVSSVIPGSSPVLSLKCEVQSVEPQIEERCKEFPFGSDYAVKEITIQDFRGRPFCYSVTAAKLIDGSQGGFYSFVFSDEDGDEIFETYLLSKAPSCEVPEWAEASK